MARLLVLNFFPAFSPASSGGELRLGDLYKAVSARHDVTMLTSTDFTARFEEIHHTPRFRELRFPKDTLWRQAYATLEKSDVFGELSGLAFALAASDPACRLRQVAWEMAPQADYIVHEFPFSEPVFAGGAPRPEIYNSHNFEASLLASIAYGHGFETALLKLLRLEGNLVARAQRVFATSAGDGEKFRLFYGVPSGKLSYCPNGFNATELAGIAAARAAHTAAHARPKLLLMGSAHHPNVEAAQFLLGLAAKLPKCDVVLAGGVAKAVKDKNVPRNAILHGPFDAAGKTRLLAEADLFLNPVTLGSGTSLKALEALAAGVPMVSTPEGARGLGLVSGEHACLVARKDFAATITRLLAAPEESAAMAAAGQAYANGTFTWGRIAEGYAAEIEAAADAPVEAPALVLALNDYPVTSAPSGGIARIRNLHENLDCDVVLVTFGQNCDFELIAPRVLLVTVPKTAAHLAYEAAVNQGQAMSVNDGVASLFAASNRVLTTITAALARRAGAVIFEHPYMAPLLEGLRQANPGIAVVYSSHNVEARHKADILADHSAGELLSAFIAEIEAYLVGQADLIACCTEADALYFSDKQPATIVVPNGCVVPAREALAGLRVDIPRDGRPRVGFLGSSHGPNVAAYSFIVGEMAPRFPDVVFEVVGNVCKAVPAPKLRNVSLIGTVDEAEKTRIMANWAVALNPIQSGGGSSLKLPDFMAHGVPTISTQAGARGFDVVGHNAGIVVEQPHFSDALYEALADPPALRRQGENAYRYAAEELDWAACTRVYRERLRRLMAERPAASLPGQKRLLVVTYRYTEPPLGGAEEYLIEVLKEMRPRFGRIDLAAIDVGHITNLHHFATQSADDGQGASARIGELFDEAVYFAPDAPPEDTIEICRRLERAWTQEEQYLFAPFAAEMRASGRVRLLCGFFWPENHGGAIKRWTSPTFAFLVPPGTWVFRISGYAAMEKSLRVQFVRVNPDGSFRPVAEAEKRVSAQFAESFALPAADGGDPVAVVCHVDEHTAPGDHRPFGVLLDRVSVLQAPAGARKAGKAIGMLEESFADLAENNEPDLRAAQFSAWVNSLREVALRHTDAVEADFAAVRGPHSAALQGWIAAHAGNYDCVLVQGMPFDVIPRTVATLAGVVPRPRVVTLPHFHGDDRFYHWRRYYDAFAAADKTLLFSESVAGFLELGEKAAVVPGGGVRADDHGDPGALKRFRDVHKDETPFFLVLGRKTASKGYERAVAAQQALRRQGVAVDLVMIGPDEDGRKLEGEGVRYLGRQPREVVRGALQTCLALVSMSTSESFGIVLCEAWLFGKPVIANRACYSFRELVRQGENGLLVQTDAEIGEAMRRLSLDSSDRAVMGLAGFNDVQGRFTWPAMASAITSVLAACTLHELTTVRNEGAGVYAASLELGRSVEKAQM